MPYGLSDNERAIIVHALQSLLDRPNTEESPPRPAVEHLLARAQSPDFPGPLAQNLICGSTSGLVVQVVGDVAGGVSI